MPRVRKWVIIKFRDERKTFYAGSRGWLENPNDPRVKYYETKNEAKVEAAELGDGAKADWHLVGNSLIQNNAIQDQARSTHFQPWKGKFYNKTKLPLLLLAEHLPLLPTKLVNNVLRDFRNANEEMKTLSQGLAGKENPSRECLHHVWNRVAFTNYVEAFHADILNKLQPRRIIVLGKGMWSRMPDTDVYMTNDVQGYNLNATSVAVCWALDPAESLSWDRLADTIHFALGCELPRRGRYPGDEATGKEGKHPCDR